MPRKLVPRRYVSATLPPASASGEAAATWERLLADPARRALLDRPGELLSEYFRERKRSRLGKIVTEANAWPDWCETLVVVASHDDATIGRALFAAAAHPFYNQLSPGGRGGRPQLLFVEPTLDNDVLQGTIDLLRASSEADVPHDRWGLVVVTPESTEEIEKIAEPFLNALRTGAAPHNPERVRFCILADDPTKEEGDIAGDLLMMPFTAWQAPTFFHPIALLASSTVGADVVQQLKGAVWFAEQAKQATPAENEAIQLAEFLTHGPTELVVWHHALKQLACCFAARMKNAIRVVDGCNNSARRRLLTASPSSRRLHLVCDAVRRDRLGVVEPISPGVTEVAGDGTIERFVPMPQPLVAAYDEVRAAEVAADITSAEIRLTRLNDPAIGELCAWLSMVLEIYSFVGTRT